MVRRILLAILASLLLFVAGGFLGRITYEPKIIIQHDIKYIPVVKIITKEIPRQVREFQSLDELKAWLAKDKTNEHEYIPTLYDCDDFALDLVKDALDDGYQIFAVPLLNHIFCCAFIGNDIYYIEPRTDDVWLYALRD
jgi:hypothetical protein